MKNNFKNIFLSIFLSLCFLFSFNSANAALVNCGRSSGRACTIDDLFNLNGGTSNSPFWINLIQTALGVSGIIILCIFIYSGVIMMFSGGDATKIGKAKQMMIGSFMGIILVFFSFTIVKTGLMILVGDKWSIYFGNSQISTTTTTTPSPTITGNCTNDSNCLAMEYCCVGDRYDLSGTKCTFSGRCIAKKASSITSFCVDDSECKTGKCVTNPHGVKLCGCDTDGSGDCKNINTEYCCNNSLTAAGFTCSVPSGVCDIMHFAYYPDAANKLKTAAGTVIENGRVCGINNNGSCIYVKKTIIDSTYYKAEWNLDSDNCDGRDTGDAVGGVQPRCFDLNGVRYCLRCMKTDIYNIKK